MTEQLTKNDKYLLRSILTSESWNAVEKAIRIYQEENFNSAQSIKRDTEFETLWQAASTDGARLAILEFFSWLNSQAGEEINLLKK